MSADADKLVAEVAGLLRHRGERMTAPRRAVLAVLAESAGHMAAEDVVTAVARGDARAHRASVYRTLDALSELGVVQHVHIGHRATTYHLVRDTGPHLHAECRSCGTVYDLPPELLDRVAAELRHEHGFALDPGHVALSGTCAACSAQGAPED